MYDDLYNFIDNLSYLDTAEDEDYQEDIIEIEQERLKQLKLDRLKLIKKVAKKIQKPSQKQPEAIVATPTITPKVAPVDVRKLAMELTEAPTEEFEETFIFSFLYNLSHIKPKKTLTLKKPLPQSEEFMNRMFGMPQDVLEVLNPEREWSENHEKRLNSYAKRVSIHGRSYYFQHHGYGAMSDESNTKLRLYTLSTPDEFDKALLYLMKEKYENIESRRGIIQKINSKRYGARYLFSIQALRWLEAEMDGKDFYHV